MSYGSSDSVIVHVERGSQKWKKTPTQAGLYAEDKLEFKGMIATLGLSLDYYNPNTDWWNYGGITRSVHLINVPNNHIVDYGINFIKNKKNNIQGWVSLSDKINNDVIIEIPELNKKLSIVASNGIAYFQFRAKPELWSPKNPKLYKLTIKSSLDSIESSRNAVKLLEDDLTRAQDIADKLKNTAQSTAVNAGARRKQRRDKSGNDKALNDAAAAVKLADDSLESARKQLSEQELQNKKINICITL